MANRNPAFLRRRAQTFSVAENTAAGDTDVGDAGSRRPGPGRRPAGLRFSKVSDAASFDIIATRGSRPDTDERGAEPRGEGEVLGDSEGAGWEGRNVHSRSS